MTLNLKKVLDDPKTLPHLKTVYYYDDHEDLEQIQQHISQMCTSIDLNRNIKNLCVKVESENKSYAKSVMMLMQPLIKRNQLRDDINTLVDIYEYGYGLVSFYRFQLPFEENNASIKQNFTTKLPEEEVQNPEEFKKSGYY